MGECKNCHSELNDGFVMECPNCGAQYCMECGIQSKRICPYCYSDLDFMG